MPESVESLELGVAWSPGAEGVLLSRDLGPSALALRAHHDGSDSRCVVMAWTGCRFAIMSPPNFCNASFADCIRPAIGFDPYEGRVLSDGS